MEGIIWININGALKITEQYPKGPHTKAGIINAGTKCGFSQKNGSHWEFDVVKLERYCEISNKPTLLDISKKVNKNVSSIKYLAMKFNIPFHKEMGRKYLNEVDADLLYKLVK